MTTKFPRVILILEDWPQLLYLADAFARQGSDVVLVGLQGQFAKLPKLRSVQTHVIESMDATSLTPVLTKLCAERLPRYIIPLTDDSIRSCAELAPELRHLLFPQLTAEHLRLISNKALMVHFAQQLGLLSPEYLELPTPGTATAFANRLGYPVVVKGATGVGGTHVRVVSDEKQLLTALDDLAYDQPVVQQYVQGQTVLGGGLFLEGRPLRLHLCVKTLTHPQITGPSVEVCSLNHELLQRNVERLCAALRWNGLASMDFIWDGKDLYFLELNPRPWGAITTTQSTGPDLLTAFAELVLGEQVKPDLQARNGVAACVFPSYLYFVVSQGSFSKLLRTLCSSKFWRGVPKSLPLFVYFIRRTIWVFLSNKS